MCLAVRLSSWYLDQIVLEKEVFHYRANMQTVEVAVVASVLLVAGSSLLVVVKSSLVLVVVRLLEDFQLVAQQLPL